MRNRTNLVQLEQCKTAKKDVIFWQVCASRAIVAWSCCPKYTLQEGRPVYFELRMILAVRNLSQSLEIKPLLETNELLKCTWCLIGPVTFLVKQPKASRALGV